MDRTPPDPTGPQPDGWDDRKWSAWCALTLEQPISNREVARRVGRATSTVASWIRDWRLQYGDEVIPRGKRTTLTPDQRAKGHISAGIASAATAREKREREAEGFTYVSGKLADYMDGWIDWQMRQPYEGVTTADMVRIARVMEILGRRRDRLVEHLPEAAEEAGPEIEPDEYPSLAALEAAGATSEDEEMDDVLDVILRAFRASTGADVVEVDEVPRAS